MIRRLALITVLVAPAARAQVVLEYLAPASCPAAPTFQALVAARVGHDPFGPSGKHRLVVDIVAISRAGFGSVVRLISEDGTVVGRRERAGTSCRKLVEQLAFSVALALDPLLEVERRKAELGPADAGLPAPPVTPPLVEPVAVAPSPPAVVAVVDAGTPPGSSGWSLFLGAGVEGGAAPHPQPLVAVEGRRALGLLSLNSSLRVAFPIPVRHALGRYALTSTALSFAPCVHASFFSACATGSVGLVVATGLDVPSPTSATGVLLEVGARIGADFALTEHQALRLALLTTFAPSTVVVLVGEDEAWRSGAFRLGAHVGWVWAF
jgi:hypothetical protein